MGSMSEWTEPRTGWALQFADDEHRGNRDIVLAAVRRDGQALEFASSQLQKETWPEENGWWCNVVNPYHIPLLISG